MTAVAAYNDEVALAVLAGPAGRRAAHAAGRRRDRGRRHPRGPARRPALTTVWQAIDAQATYLAAAVLAALDETVEPPAQPSDVVHVVARDST